MLLSRAYLVLLVIAAVVGLLVSLAAWCFLELVYQIQREVFHHLPSALGYEHGSPAWSLSALALLLVFKGLAYGLSLGSFRRVRRFRRCSSVPPQASWPRTSPTFP